jgi:hypothetical protein
MAPCALVDRTAFAARPGSLDPKTTSCLERSAVAKPLPIFPVPMTAILTALEGYRTHVRVPGVSVEAKSARAAQGAGVVLLALAAGQFLMALDSSVMNVSIATVAEDLDTSVTGIQSAIVLYTLVMAMLMVTGGKVGSILGRKRAFMLGLVIYCSGSLTTALAPNLSLAL